MALTQAVRLWLPAGLVCLLAMEVGAAPAKRKLPKEQVDFFEQKIRPVLVHSCYQCHSGDPEKAKSHFVLDNREGLRKGGESGAAITPGNPGESLLIEAIRYEGLEMPPKEKLPNEVIADFVQWVEMGAPDPRVGKAGKPGRKINMAEARKFWAFRPPQASPAPEVNDSSWPATEIDRFVLARLEKEGLKPVADADRLTLLRRVTFDLTGLPPTTEEIDAFLNDTSPRAFAAVVNRLLDSPRFGERWGRHWLDVARYAESTGKARNLPMRYAWRYRDYVIDAFNEGKPYNRFIVEQLAGDLLPAKDAAERDRLVVATGFLVLGPKDVNVKPEQFRMDQVDDQLDVTGRAFLGLTIACARCHDHKFDPIPTADYYAMAGILRSTETYSGIAPNTKHADDQLLLTLNEPSGERKLGPKETKQAQAHQRQIEKVQAELQELQAEFDRKPAQAKQVKQSKQRKAASAELSQADRKEMRQKIRQLENRLEELQSVPSPYTNFAMGAGEGKKPINCHVLDRGDVANKGPEVPRGVLTVLRKGDSVQIPPQQSGRLQMARWIASPDNPLTARVMVNRVWQHLLGRGIVDTVDNFGALGNEPSHPELLDTLAVQFMEEKWAVKRLVRSIVLSRVYQLGSDHDSLNYEKDPENKLLWRMERRRLDAEEIRDAMLLASGQLIFDRPAGSEVMKLENKTIFGPKAIAVMHPQNVRSVYLPIVRGYVPESLQVFDMADPNLIVGQRDVTTVPTQALYIMNNPFVLRQSEQMARRVLDQQGLKPAGRVELAYLVALGRSPRPTEMTSATRFVQEYRQSLEGAGHKGNAALAAWTSFCQSLFAAGQFRYVY